MVRILIVASPDQAIPVGKTTALCGLASYLVAEKRGVWLGRLAGDTDADSDASLFAAIPGALSPGRPLSIEEAKAQLSALDGEVALIEAGREQSIAALSQQLDARVVLVVRGFDEETLPSVAAMAGGIAPAPLGVVATTVAESQAKSIVEAIEGTGARCLAALPEDRRLAAPTVAQAKEALAARVLCGDGNSDAPIEYSIIAPISADAGGPYFAKWRDKAVLTRADRPDLALAALATDTACLILTAGVEPLPYIIDRASRGKTPVLLTQLETRDAARRIESMFGVMPLSGEKKRTRAAELLRAHVDKEVLASLLN